MVCNNSSVRVMSVLVAGVCFFVELIGVCLFCLFFFFWGGDGLV